MNSESNTNKIRVLLIEDEPDFLFISSRILQKAGFDVIESQSGKEALELVTTQKPDLILTDLCLPVMDGFEILRKIRENKENDHIPVVALTGNDMREARQNAIEKGFDDFWVKPFSESNIIDKIKIILHPQ